MKTNPQSACILTKCFHDKADSLSPAQDHNAAFKSKTTMEVLRALVVFQLCGINKLVDNNEMVSFVIDLIHKMSPTKNLKGI